MGNSVSTMVVSVSRMILDWLKDDYSMINRKQRKKKITGVLASCLESW